MNLDFKIKTIHLSLLQSKTIKKKFMNQLKNT